MSGRQSLLKDFDATELEELYNILNLLNHRNKNQHRRSKWWQWFSMWRRSVGNLLQDVADQNEKAVATRITWMTDFLIPSCYLSFTQQVADSQFSTLGFVLLAELARTRKAVKSTEIGNEDNLVLVEADSAASEPAYGDREKFEDLGEALARPLVPSSTSKSREADSAFGRNFGTSTPEICGCKADTLYEMSAGRPVEQASEPPLEVPTVSILADKKGEKKTRKSKKQSSGSAIDSLFEDLI